MRGPLTNSELNFVTLWQRETHMHSGVCGGYFGRTGWFSWLVFYKGKKRRQARRARQARPAPVSGGTLSETRSCYGH